MEMKVGMLVLLARTALDAPERLPAEEGALLQTLMNYRMPGSSDSEIMVYYAVERLD